MKKSEKIIRTINDIIALMAMDSFDKVKAVADLKQMSADVTEIGDTLGNFATENENKRTQIEALESSKTDVLAKLNKAESDLQVAKNNPELKSLDALKAKVAGYRTGELETFKRNIAKIVESGKHDTLIKASFGKLKKDDKGKAIFGGLEDADYDTYISKLSEYEAAGIIESVGHIKPVDGKVPPNTIDGTSPELKNSGDVMDLWKQTAKELKTA